ncbi:ABC transporter substrate-binding protein [Deinococcus roseus]|uniref:Sulfonate ABC transporter substrate-binding protein n=1 Tax=Deinococcus roseus TaxID=392414 RepID=A0ABQ2D6V2_9DEIO|nr:ABC transporter substrate-binding protein [Deinococcus roseus]GGJ46070.1 sulfonate ABC transporter substrate-binding protein [Deinococcus roseus]
MKRALLLTLLFTGVAAAKPLTIGLGYIPNVQFTPFYAADAMGYYKAEGFDVEFKHGFVSELMPLLLQGKLDAVVGDAEDAIFAQAQGAKVKYVLAMYQKLPVTIFSLAEKDITKVNDLKGKTLGIPGAFGASYIALQALLAKNKIKETDLQIAPIGFTQLEAVKAGRVDAALGFINNEPLILRQQNAKVNTLDLTSAYPMVGNGVIVSDKLLKDRATLQKILRATQKGLAYTVSNPQKAFEVGKKYFGSAGGDIGVLNASVNLMRSSYTSKTGLGYSDPSSWARAINVLKSLGKVPSAAKASDFYSNSYLTRGIK